MVVDSSAMTTKERGMTYALRNLLGAIQQR
jgi:hypothetical protein